MKGHLVYLVGPSGSGKDSILHQIAKKLPENCHIMQRVITREAGCDIERAEFLSLTDFEQLESQGGLALSWRANGLAYGVRSDLNSHLADGKTVIVNGSREHWSHVLSAYPQAILALVYVDPTLLRQRLVARGRECMQQIQLRLERNAIMETALTNKSALQHFSLWRIDNSGCLETAADTFLEQLRSLAQ